MHNNQQVFSNKDYQEMLCMPYMTYAMGWQQAHQNSPNHKNRLMINDDGNGLMESPQENLYLENPNRWDKWEKSK